MIKISTPGRTMFVCSLALVILTSCVQPALLVGTKTDVIDPDEVSIYFARAPACDYETVAYLRINGGYYSRATLLNAMQQQAAEFGADGVYVQQIRRLDILEHIGAARAIRCLSD